MISVDPAELDPTVLALPNVVHVRALVQNVIGELLDLLAGAPPPTGTTASPHPTQNGGDSGGGGDGDGGVKCSRNSDAVSSPSPSPSASSAGTAGGAEGMEKGQRHGGAQLVVSDMNAEPSVVAGVILSAMAAGLVRPGALVVATFKDFCGRHKRMRDEVALALARLKAGTAAAEGGGGGDSGGGIVVGVAGESADVVAVAGPGPAAGGGKEAAATTAPPPPTATAAGSPQCDPAGGGGAVAAEGEGVAPLGKDACRAETAVAAKRGDDVEGAGKETKTAVAGTGGLWKLERVETMKLLAGGRAEVTIVARAACEV